MFRDNLPENSGMVFYKRSPSPMAMWMKNTKIALDMLFADKNGKIVCIFENTTPYSTEVLQCDRNVALVLEINGGQVKKHNIKIGDLISHRLINKTR